MSFTTAALVVAWLAIALLALGFAGLMRQNQDLNRRVAELSSHHGEVASGLTGLHLPDSGPLADARPAGGGVVLFVAPGCPSCEHALTDAQAHGVPGELVVVSAGVCAGPDGVRCLPDRRDLLDRLSIPATPYFLHVAGDGRIVSSLLPTDAHEIAAWLDAAAALEGTTR